MSKRSDPKDGTDMTSAQADAEAANPAASMEPRWLLHRTVIENGHGAFSSGKGVLRHRPAASMRLSHWGPLLIRTEGRGPIERAERGVVCSTAAPDM